jgi:hypothetical protein
MLDVARILLLARFALQWLLAGGEIEAVWPGDYYSAQSAKSPLTKSATVQAQFEVPCNYLPSFHETGYTQAFSRTILESSLQLRTFSCVILPS